MDFAQLWGLEEIRLADLPLSTCIAIGRPPLVTLGQEVAIKRMQAIKAIPLCELVALVATLGYTHPAFMTALEVAGLVEVEEDELAALPPLSQAPTFASAGDNQHTLKAGLNNVKTTEHGLGNSAAYLAARLKKADGKAAIGHFKPASQESRGSDRTFNDLPLLQLPPAGGSSSRWKRCNECGVSFFPSRSWGRPQLYCGERCKGQAKVRFTRLRRASKQAQKLAKPCKQCGSLFVPRRRPHDFCCASCWRLARQSALRATREKQRPDRHCDACGATFRATGHANNRQRYCSVECSKQAQVLRRRARTGSDQLTLLVEQFKPEGRRRWLLRQVVEHGIEAVAAGGGLKVEQLVTVLVRLRYAHRGDQWPRTAAANAAASLG